MPYLLLPIADLSLPNFPEFAAVQTVVVGTFRQILQREPMSASRGNPIDLNRQLLGWDSQSLADLRVSSD
jgi:hypothetical protein